MSVESVEQSMSFLHFLNYDKSEMVLLNSLEKQPSGASDLQRFVASTVQESRDLLYYRIAVVAGMTLLTPIVIADFFWAPIIGVIAAYNAVGAAMKVNSLYQSFKTLQPPKPAALMHGNSI